MRTFGVAGDQPGVERHLLTATLPPGSHLLPHGLYSGARKSAPLRAPLEDSSKTAQRPPKDRWLPMIPPLDDILENFDLLDDWDDRYRYVIELGRMLPEFPEEERTDANKVRGCASQVWLVKSVEQGADGAPRLVFQGDSDAHIVKGLVAIVLATYSGRSAAEIAETDLDAIFSRIGLKEHLSAQRANGLKSMVERIRADARAALAAA